MTAASVPESPFSLRSKVVVVTGASSGIGKAIAVRCAAAGADLVITYRSNQRGADATRSAVEAAGRRAVVLRADVSREADIAELRRTAVAEFGRVDVWINNAGADILTGAGGKLSRTEKLDLVLAVDVRGTVLASWAAVEQMRTQPTGGTIINTAWDHVTFGMEGENPGLYSAAKGGIMSFSKSLARDVAPHIRVNLLAPGFIETAFGETANADWRREVERRTPLGRWGKPDDVAGAAVYLASDAAAFLTGQMILVNGGVVM